MRQAKGSITFYNRAKDIADAHSRTATEGNSAGYASEVCDILIGVRLAQPGEEVNP
jgi:hypothetical protein